MSKTTGRKTAAVRLEPRARKSGLTTVTSSDFANRFGHWSLKAQREPIGVVNNKTGTTVGYFVSAEDFELLARLRKTPMTSGWAWEMDEDLVAELKKPLPRSYRPK